MIYKAPKSQKESGRMYKGHSINNLQNSVIVLVFKI